MKIELYAVKDSLVGFSQPIAAINEQVALRQFIGSVQAEQPNICNTHPEDKSFWKIGTLDDQTGALESDLKHLANAMSFVVPKTVKEEKQNDGE